MNPLLEVVSVPEAARIANVTSDTIYYHIVRGHLTYRQTDTFYLILLDSLKELYSLEKTKPQSLPEISYS